MSKISFTARFDELDYAKMRIIAKRERRTMANLVQYFCALGIERYEASHEKIILTDEDISIE